ncbi:MAG: hypothetical protein ACOC3F_00315 [Desulfosudaceae bacterium]
MHCVTVDQEINRLWLTLGKVESPDEMAQVMGKIIVACRELRPGFTCLTDLRQYELVDASQELFIRQMQQYLVKAGLGKVVRVVKKFKALGHIQFDLSSMEVGYHAHHVYSIQEAVALLDEIFLDEWFEEEA